MQRWQNPLRSSMAPNAHFPTMHTNFWTMCDFQMAQQSFDQASLNVSGDKLQSQANAVRRSIMSKRTLKCEEEFAILTSLHLAFLGVGNVGEVQDIESGTFHKIQDALLGAIMQESELLPCIATVEHISSLVALRTKALGFEVMGRFGTPLMRVEQAEHI